jgi:hypothetical protein
MSMVVGQPSGDSLAQVLAALHELESVLSSYQGEEAEQARAATAIIERELAAQTPERFRVGKAFAKLQEIALSLGGIATAVNNIGKLLNLLGLH